MPETWAEFASRIRLNPPDVMSCREAAAYSGIGINRVWRAIRTGELKHFHPGAAEHDTRIRRVHIDAWLDSHDHPEAALLGNDRLPLSRLPAPRGRGRNAVGQ